MEIQLFGMFAEKAGSSIISVTNVGSTTELINSLKQKLPFISDSTYLLAVNQEVVREEVPLNSSDELALLPPYAGG
ncbi:MAG: MoaD/ThiS family protein [Bacteroidetes bacterium]|nr:MoaD/ThiS family protein [Bacteroidota bacterium]